MYKKVGQTYYSQFDILQKTNNQKVKNLLTKFSDSQNKPFIENTMNLQYQIGGKVLIKNHTRNTSLDNFYKGPYEIKEINYNSNRIKTEDNNKITWESLRNIKPFHNNSGMI